MAMVYCTKFATNDHRDPVWPHDVDRRLRYPIRLGFGMADPFLEFFDIDSGHA